MAHTHNKELHQRLCDYLARDDVSQANVARRIGISASTLSYYKSGNYAAPEKVERKIAAFLDREESRASAFAAPMLELSVTKKIRRALSMAHALKDAAVIVGAAGTGKSSALRAYASDTQSAVLIEVDPSFSSYTLARSVASALGVSTAGTSSQVGEMIIEKLRGSETMVIFDEADYLSGLCLDWIRRIIHDKGGCAVVLCGLPRLEFALRTARGDHDQLLSRVGVFVRVTRAGVADVRSLVKSVWNDADKALIDAVAAKAGGSVRRVTKLMQLAGRIARNNGENLPSVQSVVDAGDYMMAERISIADAQADEEESGGSSAA